MREILSGELRDKWNFRAGALTNTNVDICMRVRVLEKKRGRERMGCICITKNKIGNLSIAI